MSDLSHQMDELAGRVSLPGPAAVRNRADRRRYRQALVAGAGCVALVATTVGLAAAGARSEQAGGPGSGLGCRSVAPHRISPAGPPIAPGAVIRAVQLGASWYDAASPDSEAGAVPQYVDGTGQHPLASTDLQQRIRPAQLLRGGSATSWELQERVIRYRAGGAAAAMSQLTRAPSCPQGWWRDLRISQHVHGAGWQTLVVRPARPSPDKPSLTVVGQVGDYQVTLWLSAGGSAQASSLPGDARWLNWLGATALARVAAGEHLSIPVEAGATPNVAVSRVQAPPPLLQPRDLGAGWVVHAGTGDAQSLTGVPDWATCHAAAAGGPVRSQLQLYRRDDPRELQTVEEELATFRPGHAAAVMAALRKAACPGYLLVNGSVRAGDGAVVLQEGGIAEVAVRVGDRIALVGVGPAQATAAGTLSQLQHLAEAAASRMR